jgi:transposase
VRGLSARASDSYRGGLSGGYCERNLVERFFNNIKHFRAIATRYEKTARNFLAGGHLVCALAWLK